MKISVLPEETINKIAAGEVVSRPASIVKELIENALDAEATEVIVEVKAGGKNLVRVTDNGIGMDKHDVTLSLERHATSKIKSIEDLNTIKTLGFRGEALSSIASISRLEIVSREKGKDNAVRVRSEGGRILEVKETGAPSGTMVEVKNIFFNTPARRKFLKTNTTELTHIIKVFCDYAFVYDKCGFKLEHDGECIAHVVSKDSLFSRITVLFGKETAQNVVPLEFEKNNIKVRGYTSKPNFTKSNRSNQLIFVNNRPISSRTINYAIFEGYGTLVPRGRFPVVLLFVSVPTDTLDVNVHPTKREVKFSNERLVKEIVSESIMLSLSKAEITPAVRIYKETEEATSWQARKYKTDIKSPVAEQEHGMRGFQEHLISVDSYKNEDVCVVQMNKSYIVAETEYGFEIIDQHAAHERVMYERIKTDLKNKQSIGQKLLIPLTIELTPSEDKILKDRIQFLKEIGFNIEEFGKRTIVIDMIPSILNKADIITLVKDMLSELREMGKAVSQDNIKESIIKIMACRAAVKQGDKLDSIEMKRLLKEWRRLPQYSACPHGRPSVIKMKKEDLDKQFHRT